MEILRNCCSSLCFVNVNDDNVLPCPTPALFGFAATQRMQAASFVVILTFADLGCWLAPPSHALGSRFRSAERVGANIFKGDALLVFWPFSPRLALFHWPFECFLRLFSRLFESENWVKAGAVIDGCHFLSLMGHFKNEKMRLKAHFAIFHNFQQPQRDWQSCT